MRIIHILIIAIIIQFWSPTLKEIIPNFTPLQDIPMVLMICTAFIIAAIDNIKEKHEKV